MIALDAAPLTAVGIAEARAWLRIDGEEPVPKLIGLKEAPLSGGSGHKIENKSFRLRKISRLQ